MTAFASARNLNPEDLAVQGNGTWATVRLLSLQDGAQRVADWLKENMAEAPPANLRALLEAMPAMDLEQLGADQRRALLTDAVNAVARFPDKVELRYFFCLVVDKLLFEDANSPEPLSRKYAAQVGLPVLLPAMNTLELCCTALEVLKRFVHKAVLWRIIRLICPNRKTSLRS